MDLLEECAHRKNCSFSVGAFFFYAEREIFLLKTGQKGKNRPRAPAPAARRAAGLTAGRNARFALRLRRTERRGFQTRRSVRARARGRDFSLCRFSRSRAIFNSSSQSNLINRAFPQNFRRALPQNTVLPRAEPSKPHLCVDTKIFSCVRPLFLQFLYAG